MGGVQDQIVSYARVYVGFKRRKISLAAMPAESKRFPGKSRAARRERHCLAKDQASRKTLPRERHCVETKKATTSSPCSGLKSKRSQTNSVTIAFAAAVPVGNTPGRFEPESLFELESLKAQRDIAQRGKN